MRADRSTTDISKVTGGEYLGRIRFRTSTPADVRKTVARVINMTVNGEIDTKTANTIILGCNTLLGSIRADEQQKKIEQLERLLSSLKERG